MVILLLDPQKVLAMRESQEVEKESQGLALRTLPVELKDWVDNLVNFLNCLKDNTTFIFIHLALIVYDLFTFKFQDIKFRFREIGHLFMEDLKCF